PWDARCPRTAAGGGRRRRSRATATRATAGSAKARSARRRAVGPGSERLRSVAPAARTAAARAAVATPIVPLAGLADVQLLDRLLCIGGRLHLDEPEATRTARFTVRDDRRGRAPAQLREQRLQVLAGGREREISHEELARHVYSLPEGGLNCRGCLCVEACGAERRANKRTVGPWHGGARRARGPAHGRTLSGLFV